MDNEPVVVRTLAEAREWIANRKMRKRVRLRRIGWGAYDWGDFVVGKREAVEAHGFDVSQREIEREKCPGCKQRVPVEAICCFCDLCMENNDGMACCGCDEQWELEISGKESTCHS